MTSMPEGTEKLRILFLTQEYPPETAWGGIATYVQITARALALRGHEIHVISTVDGQDERHYRDQAVYVHRCGQWLWPPLDERIRYRMPLTRQRLRTAVSNYAAYKRLGLRFDIVEAPNWMAEGLFFSVARKCPLVTHIHSCVSDNQRTGRLPLDRDMRLAIFLENTCVARADHITGATLGALKGSQWRYIAGKDMTVVPHPMPCSRYQGIPVSRTRPLVLFVGRLEPRKNPAVIARAAPLVLKEVPDARFVFVGRDNGERDNLCAIVDTAGIGAAVEMKGWLDDAEIEALRGQARVCVVPSRWESFGLVVTEAMAAGRPVIASRIGGMSEIVRDGETGILVEPEDAGKWAEAMIQLLKDPALASTMGARAHTDVQDRFSPETAAAMREAVYLRTLSMAGRRRSRPSSTVPATRVVNGRWQ